MNVRLACLTLAFFRQLLAMGIDRQHAIELVADLTWSIYQVWARLALVAARLTPRRRSALAFATSGRSGGAVSLRFPFNAPGYRIAAVSGAQGNAFDVVHCPVSTYFREQDAADLCTASWCNLDYPLSEMTNQRLVRTQTLVQGADHCDFRILPR